jgi:hypothetical protein
MSDDSEACRPSARAWCARGIVGADARPNWQERERRERPNRRALALSYNAYCCWFLDLFRRGQIATIGKIL